MRKKLQDKMFEVSYLFELLISVIVGLAILVLAARLVMDTAKVAIHAEGVSSLVTILDDAIILAIGAELIKMLCKLKPRFNCKLRNCDISYIALQNLGIYRINLDAFPRYCQINFFA